MALVFSRKVIISTTMSKQNRIFLGKQRLDYEAEKYSDDVFYFFEHERRAGKEPRFGSYFFPAMIATCTDAKQRYFVNGQSGTPVLLDYKATKLFSEMQRTFGGIKYRKDLWRKSKESKFPIGQCAEQHAANDLLQKKNNKKTNLDIKAEIFFSKAIRPSTGEVFDYCRNCKVLFDL